jgi:hypothetical protein
MIDVCGNDGATARDLSPHKLGSNGIWDLRFAICDWLGTGMAEAQIVPRHFFCSGTL